MEKNEAINLHRKLKGKIKIELKSELNKETLALLYSPGVADACLEIKKNPDAVKDLTWTNNLVAVISDGTAVLGLGDIGPSASLPVMEGKAAILKQFANVDSIPIVLDTKDTEEIIKTIKLISKSFGAINLEDIATPRCFEIEQRLDRELDIPVFHDDQHGTTIVVMAAIKNSLKLVNKDYDDLKVVVSGVGSAGANIVKKLIEYGVKTIYCYDENGLITKERKDNKVIEEIAMKLKVEEQILFENAFEDADVFIGVSVGNIVTKEMIRKMNKKPIVMCLANPTPEIDPKLAKDAGAYIVCTGRSDYPNQVNNLLAFPGIFRGLLNAGSKNVTIELKNAVIDVIADSIDGDITPENVIPSPFDKTIVAKIATKIEEIERNKNGNI